MISSWPARYEIRVEGVLDRWWADWFSGLEVTRSGSDTIMAGMVADQPALHGLLARIGDLGMCLVSVRRITPAESPQNSTDYVRTRHMSVVIRTTRFEVDPGAVPELMSRRNTLIAAVRKNFDGLTQARLARVSDREWTDTWVWESAASMETALAAAAEGKLPEAGPAFAMATSLSAETAEVVDER